MGETKKQNNADGKMEEKKKESVEAGEIMAAREGEEKEELELEERQARRDEYKDEPTR